MGFALGIADPADLEKVFEDVQANEPGTKKYHIGVDPKDAENIWLWEEVCLLLV